jgi:hypothetical protein
MPWRIKSGNSYFSLEYDEWENCWYLETVHKLDWAATFTTQDEAIEAIKQCGDGVEDYEIEYFKGE